MDPERPEVEEEEEEEDSFDPHSQYDESTPLSATYSSYSTTSSSSSIFPSPSSHPYAPTPPMSPTQADVERFAEIENELQEVIEREKEDESSSGDEKDEETGKRSSGSKRGRKEEEEEEEEEQEQESSNGSSSDGSNPLGWHPMFSTPNPVTKTTGGQIEPPPDLISTVASPDEHERPTIIVTGVGPHSSSTSNHVSTVNTISYEEYRELQHSLDKANEQISLLKSRLSSDGRRSTIEKEKLERAQLTAKIEAFKGKIEELNYQILYGNSHKDKEIQALKAEITKLKLSSTRARIQSAGTGERGSFSLDSAILSPTPSTVSTNLESPASSGFSPTSTPPSSGNQTSNEPSDSNSSIIKPAPLFLDFDHKQSQSQQTQTQDRKKQEELEVALKASKESAEEYKSRILDLEAAFLREKELRAADRETWSRLLQEKDSELRKSQAMERTLAGMETYVDIRRLRALAGMMFCCTDLDLDF